MQRVPVMEAYEDFMDFAKRMLTFCDTWYITHLSYLQGSRH